VLHSDTVVDVANKKTRVHTPVSGGYAETH
jgi:hypothetical protein